MCVQIIGLGYFWFWRRERARPLSPRSLLKPNSAQAGVLLAHGLIRGLARPFEALFGPFPIVSDRCHRFAPAGVSSQRLNRVHMLKSLISIN